EPAVPLDHRVDAHPTVPAADHLAALQVDPPVVERADHALAAHEAVRQRTAPMGAVRAGRPEAVLGVEDRDAAAGHRHGAPLERRDVLGATDGDQVALTDDDAHRAPPAGGPTRVGPLLSSRSANGPPSSAATASC